MNVFLHQFSEMVLKILIDLPFNNPMFLAAREIFYCILSPWKLQIVYVLYFIWVTVWRRYQGFKWCLSYAGLKSLGQYSFSEISRLKQIHLNKATYFKWTVPQSLTCSHELLVYLHYARQEEVFSFELQEWNICWSRVFSFYTV